MLMEEVEPLLQMLLHLVRERLVRLGGMVVVTVVVDGGVELCGVVLLLAAALACVATVVSRNRMPRPPSWGCG